MSLHRHPSLLPAALLVALAALVWAVPTFLPAHAARLPGGTFVREQNRRAGRWLRDRASPIPSCSEGEPPIGPPVKPSGAREAVAGGLYSWTDSEGVHYVEDPSQVPEKHRPRSAVTDLPTLTTYTGSFSRLRTPNRGVPPAERIEPAAEKASAIVYSAEWCGACKQTKAYLRSLGVAVEERDVEKDPKAAAELTRLAGEDAGIPVTVIGGKVIGGFDQAALRAAVGR